MLITFLGLGTAGFLALEVKLLGPSLVGFGTIMSLLGIMSLFMLKNDVIVEEDHIEGINDQQVFRQPEREKFARYIGGIIVNQQSLYIESV